MYVCMHVSVYVCMCVYILYAGDPRFPNDVCMHACDCVCVYVCVYILYAGDPRFPNEVCICVFVCVDIYIYIYICIYKIYVSTIRDD